MKKMLKKAGVAEPQKPVPKSPWDLSFNIWEEPNATYKPNLLA